MSRPSSFADVGETDSGTSPSIMRIAVALTLVALGVVTSLALWLGPAPYPVPITDFERDLIGAEAARMGVSPYQPIGELRKVAPAWPIDSDAAGLWVAHTPTSLAGARLLLGLFGRDGAMQFWEIAQWISLAALLGSFYLYFRRQGMGWYGLAVCGAAASTLGWRSDAYWLHGASVAALALLLVLALDSSGRRILALLLLGLLVAWRPWTAPLALFLPGSRSRFADASIVGSIAVAATLLSLPWMGGLGGLNDWVSDALPANFATYQSFAWNQSLVGRALPVGLATFAFGAIALLASGYRGRVPRDTWPVLAALVIVLASPLVWPQYWFAVIPLFVLHHKAVRPEVGLAVVLLMTWPLAQRSPSRAFLLSLVASALLIWAIAGAWSRRPNRRLAAEVT